MAAVTRVLQSVAPAIFGPDGQVAAGLYDRGIGDPDLRAGLLGARLRQKQWHYLSAAAADCFVGVAVVQLGYVANFFCYLVDLAAPDGDPWQAEGLSPLGRAATMAAGARVGTTAWRAAGQALEIAADAGGWTVQINAVLGRAGQARPLRGSVRVARATPLVLVAELANGEPAYVEKEAGLLADIDLQFGDTALRGPAFGTSDWTRSLPPRDTRWHWASCAGQLADGRRAGLNLSALVYDDAAGDSLENALWIDGRPFLLGGVRFEIPAEPDRQPWRIVSRSGSAIELRFEPLGARRQDVNFGAVASQFVQPFGRFFGRAAGEGVQAEFSGQMGVVERHFARW